MPFTPRLHYEAELCAFPMADIRASDLDNLPDFGLVLCDDFTNRLTLIKDIDLSEPIGLTSFATAKSCTDCLPTGYLVVIPQSAGFYLSLMLSVYVNDALRLRFNMAGIMLSVEDIVRRSLATQNVEYIRGQNKVSLLSEGFILKGTLILTGTAGGVIFKPANTWFTASICRCETKSEGKRVIWVI